MYLITMAHHGEAQGVIETFHLQKLNHGLYKNEDMVLVITGEGPFEAATKTALTLSNYDFTSVINLGIAGTLKDHLKVGEFVKVRTLYLIQDQRPAFKTFQASSEGIDCLTSFERILSVEKTTVLKGLGDIVDREAWGVAMAAKTAGVPFKCFKIISDVAGTIEACEVVREKAEEFSFKLAQELKGLLNLPEKNGEYFELSGFHFTHTTRHKFSELLQKLAIKNEIPKDQVLKNLNLNKLRALEMTPKERTKKLLEELDHAIDPTRKIIQKKIDHLVSTFAQKGFKLQLDPLLESTKVNISFEVENNQELIKKADILKEMDLTPYLKMMNGELDVE